MKKIAAEILREYGPFPGDDRIHGVSFDGHRVWFASGKRLCAFDPDSGETLNMLDVAADAGTAFDGKHLYQIGEALIRKMDPESGKVLNTIPAPGDGEDSGLAWAEGTLWVGQHRGRRIYQVDPETGEVLRTLESDRFVTGVTWVGRELWHGTWQNNESTIRRIDPQTGDVLISVAMSVGAGVSGLESDGGDRFFCGSGSSSVVRTICPARTFDSDLSPGDNSKRKGEKCS